MSNIQKTETVKDFFNSPSVREKLSKLVGKDSNTFITSIMQITMSNDLLKNADPVSIYQAACLSAILNLPLSNSLGFAYIVPFKNRKKEIQEAQFQIGYKGFIQLALRSGEFKTISACEIYEGQIIKNNPLTGFEFDFENKLSDKVIGYCSYFALRNGFEKYFYMTTENVKKHKSKYSKYGNVWESDFDGMALKTVLKLLLSKYAPLSLEMQKAMQSDQAVIKDAETMNVEFVDNIEYSESEPVFDLNKEIESKTKTKTIDLDEHLI